MRPLAPFVRQIERERLYACALHYQAEVAPGERVQVWPGAQALMRHGLLGGGRQSLIERASIKLFMGEHVQINEPGQFWVDQIHALTQRVLTGDGVSAELLTQLYPLRISSGVPPEFLAITVTNRGAKPATFEAYVKGAAHMKWKSWLRPKLGRGTL